MVSILPDNDDPEFAPRGKWFGEDWEAATQWAGAENGVGRNVYWTLNLVSPGLNKKPKKTDIIGIRGFGVDIDPPKGDMSWSAEATLSDLVSRGQPSYAIFTGRGVQGVWLTTDTAVSHEAVETVNRGLSAGFKGDSTHNVDRLFRLPGFINHGDSKKRAAGYVPSPATLAIPFSGKTYDAPYLAQYFPAPAAPVAVAEALVDQYDERWTLGDKSDDEIIKIMLSERPNLAASFGQGVTVRDLWEGKTEGYPGQSEADMALIGKLAFYFGRNAAKIEEIFGRSALGKRDKWTSRPDYRKNTIAKVVSTTTNVYSVPPRDAATTPDTLPGVTTEEPVPGAEFLTIYEQKEHFKGCVYVADLNEVLTPSGSFMKPSTFNAMYGGHNFEFGTEAVEKKAFVAFTENRLYKFPKVQTTMFEPDMEFGYISHNRSAVNVYRADPSVVSEPGDVSPFLQHLARMLPDERDRRILLTWMASLVQNPGVKFQWAPFLQGSQGNGKSMIGQILKRAVGPLHTHEPFSDDLANKFNDWQDNKCLIIVEELSLGEKLETDNNLKTWITQDMIEMQAKGGKKMMRPNKANWVIFSNYQNGLVFTAGGRRYAPFFTAQQTAEDIERDGMGGNYFPFMWEWLRRGGYAYMTHFLQTYQCDPEFDPAGTMAGAARAPETSSTMAAIGASMGRFEMELLEMIESGAQGFRNGWVSGTKLRELEEKLRLRMSPAKRKSALEALGYVSWGRSTQVVMGEGGTKPTLYCRKELSAAGVQDFVTAQGYPA